MSKAESARLQLIEDVVPRMIASKLSRNAKDPGWCSSVRIDPDGTVGEQPLLNNLTEVGGIQTQVERAELAEQQAHPRSASRGEASAPGQKIARHVDHRHRGVTAQMPDHEKPRPLLPALGDGDFLHGARRIVSSARNLHDVIRRLRIGAEGEGRRLVRGPRVYLHPVFETRSVPGPAVVLGSAEESHPCPVLMGVVLQAGEACVDLAGPCQTLVQLQGLVDGRRRQVLGAAFERCHQPGRALALRDTVTKGNGPQGSEIGSRLQVHHRASLVRVAREGKRATEPSGTSDGACMMLWWRTRIGLRGAASSRTFQNTWATMISCLT